MERLSREGTITAIGIITGIVGLEAARKVKRV